MFTSLVKAFGEALHNLRTNFFQTILSVLGIIIGVGALVTMLALIDGLEAFARDKISGTTSLENVVISTNIHRSIDGVRVKKDTVATLDLTTKNDLMAAMPYPAKGQLITLGSEILRHPQNDSMMGVRFIATSLPMLDTSMLNMRFGRQLEAADETAGKPVTLVNGALAMRLIAPEKDTSKALGLNFTIRGRTAEIVGISGDKDPGLAAMFPFELMNTPERPLQPRLLLGFESVEDVQKAKEFTQGWLDERYAGIDEAFEISSQEFWLEEMRKGFLLFRVIMGLIVGVAVVVGGVGVMNVLLMSITERTAEIGIRKAVGANRKNIMTQFLAESVAISLIGSTFGIVLGMLIAIVVAPILGLINPELDFNAVLTFNTILTVGIVAVITGIIFGTYPARRAAGMDPVAAIQRN